MFRSITNNVAKNLSAGGTITGDLTISGDLTVNGNGTGNFDEIVNGNLAVGATDKIYLDGGNDTYITEGSANQIQFYTNGNLGFGQDATGHIFIQATDKFFLDGGSNTFLYESAADTMGFVTNSGTRLVLDNNSRISLSNNDSSGAVGSTIFGYLAGDDIADTGINNTLFGYKAGTVITTGDDNVMVGASAGILTVDSNYHVLIGAGAGAGGDIVADGTTAVGYLALTALTSGTGNTAVGYGSLDATNDGHYNTAVGYNSLSANCGDGNTAVGNQAAILTEGAANTAIGGYHTSTYKAPLQLNATGSYTIAIGSGALMSTTAYEVDGSVAIGYGALKALNATSGGQHASATIGIGMSAGAALNAGVGNVAIGHSALGTEDTGDGNTAVGYQSLMACNGADNNGNTAVGYQSGLSITTGTGNVALGFESMGEATGNAITGEDNTCVGFKAGFELSGTASNNTLVGTLAGWNLEGVDGNTAVGRYALQTSSAAVDCVAIGTLAMNAGTATQAGTVAIGKSALTALTTGANNTAVGHEAMSTATTALNSVSIGRWSMKNVKDEVPADGCIAIGASALYGNSSNDTTIGGSIAIGSASLYALQTGIGNIAIGYTALTALTTGVGNLAIGHSALKAQTDGTYNIAIGYEAMDAMNSGEDHNIGIGYGVMGTMANAASVTNVAIGSYALDHTAGAAVHSCVGVGFGTLGAVNNATASGSTGIGYSALSALTAGVGNLAVGYNAMATNKLGDNNIAIGYGAMDLSYIDDTQDAITDGNLFIGIDSGGGDWATAASKYNVAVGNYTMDAIMIGALNNTALGYNAASTITTGDSNVCIGAHAGNHDINLTTGGNNTVVGGYADVSATGAVNQTVIGYDVTGQQNHSVTLGNADVTDVFMGSDSGALVHTTGISFPASQVASGGSNCLDDYEEGTWTPTDVSGASLTAAATAYGKYTRVGNVVHAKLTFTYPATANTATPRIGGLPYAAVSDNINNSGTYHKPNNSELGTTDGFGIRTNAGASYIELIKLEDGGDAQNDDVSGLSVVMSITYWA